MGLVLDRFKHINDSLGHAIGDQLLQFISSQLMACVRGADTVSRTGGDEFVILLSEVTHADDAAISAKKILAALSNPAVIAGNELQVTVSIGISIYPNDGADAGTLIKNADMAMYHAKDCGRNDYHFFTRDMITRSIERQSIESSLRNALERREFVMHYQAKVDLETGTIIGAEALIRWCHPHLGLMMPEQFISIAEDSGLIVSIGNWALHETCRQIGAWLQAGLLPVPVAVNISALEFRDSNFLDKVRAILVDTGLAPRYLELELTESVLMQNAESTVSILKELKRIGVQLAIDDFGTGYSSLSYLSSFPIDVLKIDQSFVREIATAPHNATIVSAVIGMRAGLKCRVIAEGVETQEQAKLLQALHCCEAQGFYFHRPMVAAEFARLLPATQP